MAGTILSTQALCLRCLGVPLLCRGTEQQTLTQQHTRLLSVLVAAGPNGMEADGILDALWGEDLPKTGTQAVYSLVGRLADKDALIVNEAGRYRISGEVDVDAWRFDGLLDGSDIDAQLEGIKLWKGRPFDGVEAGDGVAGEAARLVRKRIAATEDIARRATPDQLRDIEEQILDATNDDPYNEPLVIAASSALYRLNRRRDALSILQACRARLRGDLGLGGSAELDAAELALLNDENPIADAPATVAEQPTRIDPLPLLLTPRASVFVGRDAALNSIADSWSSATGRNGRGSVVVVNGDAGIGKSELVAQFANQIDGANVRAGTNSTGSSAAYAMWLQALPEATDALEQLSASPDPGAANLVFWRDVERTIATLADSSPLVIVLEDLHQSDPQSTLLFSWLASGSLPGRVLILATTRPASADSAWSGVINELRKRQDTGIVNVIDVDPLSLTSIQQMVAARFPDENPARVYRFASQVHALSQGNPLVGSALIRDAKEPDDLVTGSTLTIEEHHAQAVCGRVDSAVAGVLTNAGLVGYEFDVATVAALGKITPEQALMHLETAMAAGLVIEAEQLGRFRFDHILTTEAFAQRASRLRRSQTYRSLIDLENLPAADRVRYIRGAFVTGTEDESRTAAKLLWDEATKLSDALSFTEARSACEYAVETFESLGEEVSLDLLMLRAEVTARSGDLNRMEQYRQVVFDAAQAQGSADGMARAALVGLPATERHGGDASLLQLLSQVDSDLIVDNRLRGQFLYQFVRAARLGDRLDLVDEQTQQGVTREEMADDEMWAEFRHEQLQVGHQRQPDVRTVDEFDKLIALLEPSYARTHLKFRAMLFSISHQLDDALTRRLDEARAEQFVYPSARVQWALELTESAMGQVGMLDTVIDPESTLATGFRLGVADAFTSFGAQSWHGLWRENRFGEAMELLEGARGLIEPNVGWRCAEAFNLAAIGRRDEAAALASQATDELRQNPTGPWSPPAAALLIEACRRLDNSAEWAHAAAEVLAPCSGTAIILGTGVAHLGPADLAIGHALAIVGDDAASAFIKQGEEQIRRTGYVPWQAELGG